MGNFLPGRYRRPVVVGGESIDCGRTESAWCGSLIGNFFAFERRGMTAQMADERD
jgi:hypothetical protein